LRVALAAALAPRVARELLAPAHLAAALVPRAMLAAALVPRVARELLAPAHLAAGLARRVLTP